MPTRSRGRETSVAAYTAKRNFTITAEPAPAASPHWRRWLGPENRCLVPFTSFSETELTPGGSKQPIWFSFDEDRPLAFFAGIWTRWTAIRKIKEGVATADLFGFLTTEPNAESEASALQRPLRDGSLRVVLEGEKQGGTMELVNLAAQASQPHAELPLPLLDGAPDRPDDAATVAVVENGRQGTLL